MPFSISNERDEYQQRQTDFVEGLICVEAIDVNFKVYIHVNLLCRVVVRSSHILLRGAMVETFSEILSDDLFIR